MGSQRVGHDWATTWCDVMIVGSDWGETEDEGCWAPSSTWRKKTRLPAGGKVPGLRDPPAPLSHTSHSPPAHPSDLTALWDVLWHSALLWCGEQSHRGSDAHLPFFSHPCHRLLKIWGRIDICVFFPKCCGSNYMNYLLKNTSKLPLFSCSAARNKMPLEWGKQ